MDVNWTQIGWGCVFGIVVGILVYGIGSYLDWRRDRRWDDELNGGFWRSDGVWVPFQRKSEENDPDGA